MEGFSSREIKCFLFYLSLLFFLSLHHCQCFHFKINNCDFKVLHKHVSEFKEKVHHKTETGLQHLAAIFSSLVKMHKHWKFLSVTLGFILVLNFITLLPEIHLSTVRCVRSTLVFHLHL